MLVTKTLILKIYLSNNLSPCFSNSLYPDDA